MRPDQGRRSKHGRNSESTNNPSKIRSNGVTRQQHHSSSDATNNLRQQRISNYDHRHYRTHEGESRAEAKNTREKPLSDGKRVMTKMGQQGSTPITSDSDETDVSHYDALGLMRLNQFISMSGYCARRQADVLIQSGAVRVNGELVTTMGARVHPAEDKVYVHADRIRPQRKRYFLLNKPAGYMTTMNDELGRKSVMELTRGLCEERIFPVGRLDESTTGVLMLTNDGSMARWLSHPSSQLRKIYRVELHRPISHEDVKQLLTGVQLTDGGVKADRVWMVQGVKERVTYSNYGRRRLVEDMNGRVVRIQIHSGRNRIVKRMFAHLGYIIQKLERVDFAGLHFGQGLPDTSAASEKDEGQRLGATYTPYVFPGKVRELNPMEIQHLKQQMLAYEREHSGQLEKEDEFKTSVKEKIMTVTPSPTPVPPPESGTSGVRRSAQSKAAAKSQVAPMDSKRPVGGGFLRQYYEKYFAHKRDETSAVDGHDNISFALVDEAVDREKLQESRRLWHEKQKTIAHKKQQEALGLGPAQDVTAAKEDDGSDEGHDEQLKLIPDERENEDIGIDPVDMEAIDRLLYDPRADEHLEPFTSYRENSTRGTPHVLKPLQVILTEMASVSSRIDDMKKDANSNEKEKDQKESRLRHRVNGAHQKPDHLSDTKLPWIARRWREGTPPQWVGAPWWMPYAWIPKDPMPMHAVASYREDETEADLERLIELSHEGEEVHSARREKITNERKTVLSSKSQKRKTNSAAASAAAVVDMDEGNRIADVDDNEDFMDRLYVAGDDRKLFNLFQEKRLTRRALEAEYWQERLAAGGTGPMSTEERREWEAFLLKPTPEEDVLKPFVGERSSDDDSAHGADALHVIDGVALPWHPQHFRKDSGEVEGEKLSQEKPTGDEIKEEKMRVEGENHAGTSETDKSWQAQHQPPEAPSAAGSSVSSSFFSGIEVTPGRLGSVGLRVSSVSTGHLPGSSPFTVAAAAGLLWVPVMTLWGVVTMRRAGRNHVQCMRDG